MKDRHLLLNEDLVDQLLSDLQSCDWLTFCLLPEDWEEIDGLLDDPNALPQLKGVVNAISLGKPEFDLVRTAAQLAWAGTANERFTRKLYLRVSFDPDTVPAGFRGGEHRLVFENTRIGQIPKSMFTDDTTA